MKTLTPLLFLALLSSCSVLRPAENPGLDVDVLYRKDMIITVNGETFEGMGTVDAAKTYNFNVEAVGQLDMFLFSSCNREWMKERAWNVKRKVKSGLFGWGRKLRDQVKEIIFPYTPIAEIEQTYCPVSLYAAEKSPGRHSWGFVDFRTPNFVLPAELQCNGEVLSIKGVGVCQSRKGKTQVIKFTDEVVVPSSSSCPMPTERGTSFEFTLPRGECVYSFTRIKRPHLEFRLTTYGYDKIPMRQE